MEPVLTFIKDNPVEIAYGLTLLAAVLPRPEPDSLWAWPRRLLDFVAANWGQARNAPKPRRQPSIF